MADPEQKSDRFRTWWWVGLGSVGLVVVLAIIADISRQTEMRLDTTSGRVRRATYLLGVKVSDEEVTYGFTRFAPAGADSEDVRAWSVYSRTRPARWFWRGNSRDSAVSFSAGSTVADLKQFAIEMEVREVPDEHAQRLVARLVMLLKAGGARDIRKFVAVYQPAAPTDPQRSEDQCALE